MIKLITEDIFNNTLIEVHNYFRMLESRNDSISKNMIRRKIRYKLMSLIDYWLKNHNYMHLSDEDFYDEYEKMIDRAFRNFDPSRGTLFKTYFSDGLGKKKFEVEKRENEKKREEVSMVEDKEYYDGEYEHDTVNKNKLTEAISAEDEYFEKELDKENHLASIRSFFGIGNEIIKLKQYIEKNASEAMAVYYPVFFTNDNITLIRNGSNLEENKEKKFKKHTYITSEEVLDTIEGDADIYYQTLEKELLTYIFVSTPKNIQEISQNELKKNKDIMGQDCDDPEDCLKIPLEERNVIKCYLRDVKNKDVTPQAISKSKIKYEKLLGKYRIPVI